jgi:hypothetical protein
LLVSLRCGRAFGREAMSPTPTMKTPTTVTQTAADGRSPDAGDSAGRKGTDRPGLSVEVFLLAGERTDMTGFEGA